MVVTCLLGILGIISFPRNRPWWDLGGYSANSLVLVLMTVRQPCAETLF